MQIKKWLTDKWDLAVAFVKKHSLLSSVVGVALLFLAIAVASLAFRTVEPVIENKVVEPVVTQVEPTKVDPMVLPPIPKKVEKVQKNTEKSTKYTVEEKKEETKNKVVKIEEPDPLTLLPEYREALQEFEAVTNPKGTR